MALGQFVTGMAFSNVGLGIAHSIAHTLGAVYDTPHGVACAMMLPIVMAFNADVTGEKYKAIAEAMAWTPPAWIRLLTVLPRWMLSAS